MNRQPELFIIYPMVIGEFLFKNIEIPYSVIFFWRANLNNNCFYFQKKGFASNEKP